MKLKVLNRDYSLAYTEFEANGIKYKLTGTKCEEWEKINLCEDYWKDEKGKYHTIVREILLQKQIDGLIKPIESSEVKLNTEIDKKPKRRTV